MNTFQEAFKIHKVMLIQIKEEILKAKVSSLTKTIHSKKVPNKKLKMVKISKNKIKETSSKLSFISFFSSKIFS